MQPIFVLNTLIIIFNTLSKTVCHATKLSAQRLLKIFLSLDNIKLLPLHQQSVHNTY